MAASGAAVSCTEVHSPLEEEEFRLPKWTDFMTIPQELHLYFLRKQLIRLADSRDRLQKFHRLTSHGRLATSHYVCWEEMMDSLMAIKVAMEAYIRANPHPI